ncbi:MAG: RdgB/HAM1 family non-canonical purine NTP pyrophosphatase [Maricaulis sp.]|jgi:XTP/dITP diphosphohydrolase|nr:RdgB/HAM1 family non-canonical purine NTP pyrophosphatase [Maricaulis sp.]MDG2042980.1 RdgB/HAM1 family non-canonical purine NTP pyrophosphatase [Maricaulis sp.]
MTRKEIWVLSSHNHGKIKELKDILEPYGVGLSSAAEMSLPEPEETEKTFVGNAILKAEAARDETGMVCLADDSGLCVDALGGDPGVLSARWGGEARDFDLAMRRVHEALEALETNDRTARFVCVIALARPDGSVRDHVGEIVGSIVWPPRGDDGFGYDAIFQPEGHNRTFAEMSRDEKRALSHRGRALASLVSEEFG